MKPPTGRLKTAIFLLVTFMLFAVFLSLLILSFMEKIKVSLTVGVIFGFLTFIFGALFLLPLADKENKGLRKAVILVFFVPLFGGLVFGFFYTMRWNWLGPIGFAFLIWIAWAVLSALWPSEEHQVEQVQTVSRSQAGQAYEIACARRLKREGYTDVRLTPATGDFGADIVATHPKGFRVCFQCKYYSSNVGEDAVQEVISAVHYYHADAGAVLTNADFTPKARELAREANVALMPHYNAQLDWIDRIEEFDAFMN